MCSTNRKKATRRTTEVARLMVRVLSSNRGSVKGPPGVVLPERAEKKALGIKRAKPATSIKPEPVSLMTSWKACSSRLIPPTKKQVPRQRSRLAKMEPRMAAWMTGIRLLFVSEEIRTINSTISTTELKVVSIKTPSTLGNFRASSPPAKPSKLAAGTIAI